jgi:hypothetical protein
MIEEKTQGILDRLRSNRSYSAKLSWKRKQTLELRSQIAEFIQANFDIDLPVSFSQFKKYADTIEPFSQAAQNCLELIRAYYNLGNFGESIGSLFLDNSGNPEVFTNAHLFSKNRVDPVWNWKKSKLIRASYHRFLQETDIHEIYTPVHITLTLPHPGGLYEGKKFYASELISQFNLLRKSDWWKQCVYAGEYGIEVTGGKNGLHIHLHSLAFLYNKDVKGFRSNLQEAWQYATGATQVWVESLYVYKKDASGQYITQMKDASKLLTHEQSDGTYTSVPEGKVIVRKKFYLQDEKKAILASDIEDKESAILDLYTRAILECIKYHFKDDSMKLPDGNYNIFLLNEILQNTKGKRLYSRYGKFYKEQMLNFNKIDSTEVSFNEANTTMAINPHTFQEIPVEETQLVIFKPERIHYSGPKSIRPNTPFSHGLEVYEQLESKDVKRILTLIIQEKFKPRQTLSHDDQSNPPPI